MLTYTAFTTVTGKQPGEALGLALEDLEPAPTGVGVFEIEDGSGLWEVAGYFLERPNDIELALLSAAYGSKPFVISEVPDVDWVAKVKRDLSPVEAGRFFVYGSHDAENLPPEATGLLIEAAMAFGTGHHGTTLGCLRAFDRLLDAGETFDTVLDLGCGTAVLAMAAAKVFGRQVWASDIDPVAVEVAVANAQANDLSDKVACIEATGLDHPDIAAVAPFDLIFANILKGPLLELAPDIASATQSGGIAILSGLLVEQAEGITQAYVDQGFSLHHREDIGEWSALTLRKG